MIYLNPIFKSEDRLFKQSRQNLFGKRIVVSRFLYAIPADNGITIPA